MEIFCVINTAQCFMDQTRTGQ